VRHGTEYLKKHKLHVRRQHRQITITLNNILKMSFTYSMHEIIWK